MALLFPRGAQAGQALASQDATRIANWLFWVARLSNELVNDAVIDLKKLGQLVQEGRKFYDATPAGIDPRIKTALRNRLAQEGLEWASEAAMTSDIGALRTSMVALYQYIKNNMAAEMSAAASIGFDPDQGGGSESTATIAKPHAVEPLISAVRAHFV